MKTRFWFGLLVVFLLAPTVSAQIFVSISGYGSAYSTQFSSSFAIPSLGNTVDPIDPSNGMTPLTFNLATGGLNSLVSGDVEVVNPFNPTVVTDLLRFIPGKLLVYSDLPAYAAADVGIPVLRQSNLVTLQSSFGFTNYVPTFSVQPGAQTFSFFGNGTIYDYTVSVPPVPEPGMIGIVSIAVCLILRRQRGRHCRLSDRALVDAIPKRYN